MALTTLTIKISNPANVAQAKALDFLIDSGAAYSVVPTDVLKSLKIKPEEKRRFILADGSAIERSMGIARFEYEKKKGGAPVIFGNKSDSTLLGATTLEAMGLALDPLKRQLIPLPMVLG